MRSRIQPHGRAAGHIFAGSHPGLMAELFTSRDRAFYEQARPVVLGPLDTGDLPGWIAERFTAAGKEVGDMLDPLLELARGHPQRAMMAAYYLWAHTAPGQTASPDAWTDAVNEVFALQQEPFERVWSLLGQDQRRVLDAVAAGAGALFAADTLARFSLSRGGAQAARDALLYNGTLSGQGGQLEIIDPLFAAWIRAGRRAPSL